jgi:hypothetical protein
VTDRLADWIASLIVYGGIILAVAIIAFIALGSIFVVVSRGLGIG